MLPRLPLLSRDIQSWKAPNATDKRGTHGFPCERILGKSAHSSETSAHVTVCTHTHRQATPSAGSSRWVWPDKATSARAQPIAAQQRNGEWVCRGMAGDKGWRRRRVWVLCALVCVRVRRWWTVAEAEARKGPATTPPAAASVAAAASQMEISHTPRAAHKLANNRCNFCQPFDSARRKCHHIFTAPQTRPK